MLSPEAKRTRRISFNAARALAAAALVSLAVLAGCSGDGEGDPTSNDPFAEGDARLTVTLDPDGAEGPEDPQAEEVSCEESTENATCLAIRDVSADDFDPAPADQACTELFGGPDEATLSGDIDGEEVDAELTRANGCEIERFDRAVPLLEALFDDYQPGEAIAGPEAG